MDREADFLDLFLEHRANLPGDLLFSDGELHVLATFPDPVTYRSRMPLGLDHGGWHLWRLGVSWARDRYRTGRGIRGTGKAQILKTRAGGRQIS